MNDHNLIPNSKRSREQLQEMGRKGGIKSGETRRRKRQIQKEVKLWLDTLQEIEMKEPEKVREWLRKVDKIKL